VIRFLDGPAAGVVLRLRDAPAWLRAVRDGAGRWDALDQPGDAPAAGEEVFVYRRQGEADSVHVSCSERGRRRGRWLVRADYVHHAARPSGPAARESEAWAAWRAAQAATGRSVVSEQAGRPAAAADVERVVAALAAPFDAAEVKFKAQAAAGDRALAVPYVDARAIQDRLDDVLGIMNWQDSYEVLPDGAVVCRLKVRLGDEWIVKEDVGGQSEQPDEGDRRKAAFSDALKRAAVKFGIGRYLYRHKPRWVDYDAQKRRFAQAPVLAEAPAPPPRQEARQARQGQPGERPWEKLHAFDARLAALGLFAAGDLVRHVAGALRPAEGPDVSAWGEAAWEAARGVTAAFVEARRGQLDARITRLLAAKGETFARLKAKLKSQATIVAELTHEQASRGAALLEALPDARPQAAGGGRK